MKTGCSLALFACLGLFLSGCGSSPKSQIIGKWEATGPSGKLFAEFTTDGKATLSMIVARKKITGTGTYKVNGDELVWTTGGETKKYKIKMNGSDLVLTSDAQTITYKRV